MRFDGIRKKKLIVAFHFQHSNQAGWRCDTCRRDGLEIKRRCGFVATALETPAKTVWARKKVATDSCPTSVISAQSLAWIEQFYVWRKLGPGYPGELSAREVEAILILEQETRAEESDGG